MSQAIGEALRVVAEPLALGTTVATVFYILPPTAALAAIVWYAIVITEKLTGKPFHQSITGFFKKKQ